MSAFDGRAVGVVVSFGTPYDVPLSEVEDFIDEVISSGLAAMDARARGYNAGQCYTTVEVVVRDGKREERHWSLAEYLDRVTKEREARVESEKQHARTLRPGS